MVALHLSLIDALLTLATGMSCDVASGSECNFIPTGAQMPSPSLLQSPHSGGRVGTMMKISTNKCSPLTEGPLTSARFGVWVQRGPDFNERDQGRNTDGGEGNLGMTVKPADAHNELEGWVLVRWRPGSGKPATERYRVGAEGAFDLCVVKSCTIVSGYGIRGPGLTPPNDGQYLHHHTTNVSECKYLCEHRERHKCSRFTHDHGKCIFYSQAVKMVKPDLRNARKCVYTKFSCKDHDCVGCLYGGNCRRKEKFPESNPETCTADGFGAWCETTDLAGNSTTTTPAPANTSTATTTTAPKITCTPLTSKRIGVWVQRGPDFATHDKLHNTDGGAGNLGRTVNSTIEKPGWVLVRWNGVSNLHPHRVGANGAYDLCAVKSCAVVFGYRIVGPGMTAKNGVFKRDHRADLSDCKFLCDHVEKKLCSGFTYDGEKCDLLTNGETMPDFGHAEKCVYIKEPCKERDCDGCFWNGMCRPKIHFPDGSPERCTSDGKGAWCERETCEEYTTGKCHDADCFKWRGDTVCTADKRCKCANYPFECAVEAGTGSILDQRGSSCRPRNNTGSLDTKAGTFETFMEDLFDVASADFRRLR